MKNILVPVDGSESSDRAVLQAKELALALGAKITLVNVISVVSAINYYPNMRYSQLDAILDWPSLVEEAKKSSKELLEAAKAKLEGVEVELAMLDQPDGAIARAISDFINQNEVDMVVMGSVGIGSLKQRLYLGSVTLKTLHFVNKPILIVQ